jgi:hypothetical protein
MQRETGLFQASRGFVLRQGHKMLAHTFRGSTWKSALGLGLSPQVYERCQAIRKAERNYLPLEVPTRDFASIPRESPSQPVRKAA